jgi:GntR family transcriptional regulator, transcriptional repressor for pyruvate dehydrogenase complex
LVGPSNHILLKWDFKLKTLKYDRIKPRPIFEQIIDQIKSQIMEGALKPGDILPPERQLSDMIGVNRHSVREALKVLEYMGVVTSRTGIGTTLNNAAQDVLVEQFNKLGEFSPRQFLFELMELRQILEPAIAALAAQRATEDDLEIMQQAMEDFKKEFENGTLGSDADERLHVAIANSTHNSTLLRLAKPIMSMLAQFREKSLHISGRRVATYQEHERIYLAVKNRNPAQASAAMVDHMAQVETMLRKIEIKNE